MSAMDNGKHDGNPNSLHGFYGWTDTLKGVFYGPGSVKTALPKLLSTLGVRNALVVTGKSLYTKTSIVKTVEGILQELGAHGDTFYDIGEHSPIAGIRRGMESFNKNKCDVIVAVGGGSPVDASKAILYHLQKEMGGKTLPQIAIPTTLSAAEYSGSQIRSSSIGAGYTDDNGQKVAVSSQDLAPAGIILDAELTLPTPERLWLSTGIRALDHTVETLYRPLVPIPVKILCYAAMADLFTYLPLSKANPSSVEIRQKLQLASWMSLWPLKLEKYSALGISHALGHKLGATYGIPHGITSCLTLAPTVALQSRIASQENKEHLAKSLFYLQEASTGSVDGDVRLLSSMIQDLIVQLGLKASLSEYKVPTQDLPGIAEGALGNQDEPIFSEVVKLLEGLYV
ncbi:alcohol dehydrogenase IV [Collybia nuda]|uniref:Alcohol dehydrogenase IV n=1 Tax=Collybia nuda TaxID=64659 RepID=A0A9P6CLR4_9AGAR|nr:alcohol dehydrogenase IV [Collybia nuda]